MLEYEKEENEVKFESIIAGVLVKYRKVDFLELSIILRELERVGLSLPSRLDYRFPLIGSYIKHFDDGRIELRKGINLDKYAKGMTITIREWLKLLAGTDVMNGLENLDVVTLMEEKRSKILMEKGVFLTDCGVLLISDDDGDYEALKSYGFKNVDYFKSLVRASKYFENNSENLSKYQFFVLGSYRTLECFDDMRLFKAIRREGILRNIIVASISRFTFGKDCIFHIDLDNYRIEKNNIFEVDSYQEAIDRLVEGAVANRVLDTFSKGEPFVSLEQSKTEVGVSLPSLKEDLRILYLDAVKVTTGAEIIAKSLGLNVEFKSDNIGRLEKISDKLGDYDIIIASEMYSRELVFRNAEASKQCRDTGRKLVLLATYRDESLPIYSLDSEVEEFDLGKEVTLNYIYSGLESDASSLENCYFKVPREGSVDDTEWEKYHQSELAKIRAILEVASKLYERELIKIGGTLVLDEFRTPHDLDVACIEAFKDMKRRQDKILEPIRIIDEIKYYVKSFIEYSKVSLIADDIPGIRIAQSRRGFRIESTYRGQVLCALTLTKKDRRNENLRVFTIQQVNKHGNLMDPISLGVYTKKFEDLSIPPRPTANEWNVVMNIHKKVMFSIKPLVDVINNNNNEKGKRISFTKMP